MDHPPGRGRRVPLRCVAVGLYAACVVAASMAVPPSGGLPAHGPLGVVGFDKWIHTGAYALLAAGAAAALGVRTRRTLLYAVVAAVVVGAGVEVVQAFLPYRSSSLVDAAANAAGSAAGAVVWWTLSGRRAS